jgi:hypothetical protein
MFCKKCGTRIDGGGPCPNCSGAAAQPWRDSAAQVINKEAIGAMASSLADRSGVDASMFKPGVYERGVPVAPGSVEPNEGEVPVRQYSFAVLRTRLKLMRAEGRLQVTNKRLLFRATGRSLWGKTTLHHEFAIDDIAGVEMHKDFRFSLLNFILGFLLMQVVAAAAGALIAAICSESPTLGKVMGVVLCLLAMAGAFAWMNRFWLRLLPVGLSWGFAAGVTAASGLVFGDETLFTVFAIAFAGLSALVAMFFNFLIAFPPNLEFHVKTKAGQSGAGSVSIKRQGFFGIFGDNSGYSEVLPSAETDAAIRELGAVINDIQKLGDHGIEKWKK